MPAPVKGEGFYEQPRTNDGANRYLGTFSTMSFITVGDKYGVKPPADGGTRRVGKQLQVPYPKKQVYFTAEHPLLGGKYEETQPTRYRVTQPRDGRKKGFLSGDAQKRDMCMNTCMNAIQTQTITKENRALKAAREKALEAHAELEASRPPRSGRLSAPPVLPTREEPLQPLSPRGAEKRAGKDNGRDKDKSRRRRRRPRPVTHDLSREDPLYEEGRSGPEFVFDIGRGAETTFCPGSRRERWFEPRMRCGDTSWSRGERVMQGFTKRYGSAATQVSSRTIGAMMWQPESGEPHPDHDASPFGRRSILQNQLTRNSGALLPPFFGNAISAAGPPGSQLLL